MHNKKIKMLLSIFLLVISTFLITTSYSKYANKYSGTININIRKPNYTVVFNSNAPAGKVVNGTMNNQQFIYGIAQNLYENNYSINGYEFARWKLPTDNSCIYFSNKQNVNNLSSTENAQVNLYAEWNYNATPVITRVDYNTFSYNATSADAYYVSTSNVKPEAGSTTASSSFSLNTWTTSLSTNDLTLSANQVYYVWAKDAITGGNVSENSASIIVRTINRSVGTGSTLTTKLNSSSGTSFTTTPYYVLDGTTIYVSSTANSGYHSAVLNRDGAQVTNNTTYTINKNTTFASSATANSASITINKDGAAWSASGMKVTLYNGANSTSHTATVSSGSVATLNAVPNGTYNIYAGKDSSNKTTLIDTGVDITINNNNVSKTINYYSLTLAAGTGISSVSNGGTSTTSAKQYLYIAGGTQQSIEIDATVSAGYNWSKWTKTAGTNPSTFTATDKSPNIKLGAGAVTLTANTTPRLLASESTLKVGDYVNYPVDYSNVKGIADIMPSPTGWRVLSKSGSGTSAYVVLVSAGIPLTYRVKADTSKIVGNVAAKLKGTTNTGFFSIEMNKKTATYDKFHNCGISGVSSTDDLREKFINNYTQVNTYNGAQYPNVRSMTKEELDEVFSGPTTTHGSSVTSNNLLAVASTTSGKYAPYILANKVELNGSYYLWAVYDQGKLIETAGDQGVRLVVTLRNTVKTSGKSNEVWQIIP